MFFGPSFIEVSLTDGKVALVDAIDISAVAGYHWTATKSRNTYYAKAHAANRTIYMHRIILFGDHADADPRKVDHVSGNGLDNRRQNLRAVNDSQNAQNSVGRKAARKSRFKGVSLRRHRLKPYRAIIDVDGKQKHLGYFASEEEAAEAYDKAALRFFGSHARTNHPEQLASQADVKEAA